MAYISAHYVETAERSFDIETKTKLEMTVVLKATVNGQEDAVLRYGLNNRQSDRKLADRLIAAWKARAFYKTLTVRPYSSSVNRPSEGFIWAAEDNDFAPLGRKLSADLKRMGF